MKTIARLLLVLAALQSVGQLTKQAHCFSYFDENILPTAKLVLNKIQQSLSSSRDAQSFEQAPPNELHARDEKQQQQQQQLAANSQSAAPTVSQKPDEPNKNEFVKLDTARELGFGEQSSAPVELSETNSDNLGSVQAASEPTVVSSTAATNVDPTNSLVGNSNVVAESAPEPELVAGPAAAAVPSERTPELKIDGQVGIMSPITDASAQPATKAEPDNSNKSGPLEATTTTTSTTSVAPTEPNVVVAQTAESKSAEELVKETELEAVAAVDASIGFGSDLFSSTSDSCYDEYANARHCEPEFENVAFERQVEVSSECGIPPSRFCTAHLNEHNEQIRNCHICDAQHPKKRHPAAYLTDLNNSNSPTCWVSAPINAPQVNSSTAGDSMKADNVTLVLNLEKKYEITYISLQFCSLKPDTLAIYKSADFGRSWTPYQFYSSQCRRMYGRWLQQSQSQSQSQSLTSRVGELEASCTNSSLPGGGQSGASSARIAFSTLDARGGQNQLDRSLQLQDWITATNIKIVLDRHQSSWIHSTLGRAHHHLQPNPERAPRETPNQQVSPSPSPSPSPFPSPSPSSAAPTAPTTSTSSQQNGSPNSEKVQDQPESSLTSPSDTFNYAMSDLTIGGRCKCNGHASRCVHGQDGRLQCDCRHNTAGRDCEKCAPFHLDRPWARATQLDANPCQPCNCNGHSRKCRFDEDLYRLSGRRSGGVCLNCRDNTDGRYCHYCREGFTRDHSKPMSDKEACKHCDCHPVGSLGRACNQTTGQCPCKEGVAGLQCNRCSPGYQQSSSPAEPCIKLLENDINAEPSVYAEEQPVVGDSQASTDQESSSAAGSEPFDKATGEAQPDAHSSWRPPGGAHYLSKSRLDQPADDVSDANELDNGDDNEPDLQTFGSRSRIPIQADNQWSRRQPATYYRYNSWNRARYDNLPPDEDESNEHNLSPNGNARQHTFEQDFSPQTNGRGYLAPNYGTYPKHFKHRRPLNSRPRPANELPLSSVANLDHDTNELNGMIDEGGYQMGASIYDDNFNQIRATTNPHRIQQTGGRGRNSMRNSMHIQTHNSLACGDCRSGTRRLTSRRFCQLEFAVKALVLDASMADDWTKFDVELQDIFKSPGSESMLNAHANSPSYLDNMLQADEPAIVRATQRSSTNRTSENNSDQQLATTNSSHRLKVGAEQSVWVPTEDLNCKCPRLKRGSTYLLMGSLDTKKNSANVLQLDRHGLAIEWKPSLQDKLIKYQRRNSRGAC